VLKKKSCVVMIALISIFVLMGLLAVGCGDDVADDNGVVDDEIVTITFANWMSAEEGTRDLMRDVLAEFEDRNPDIKVEVMPIGVSEIEDQLFISATAGNPPDLAQVQGDMVFNLALAGFTAPVDDLIPPALAADFPPHLYDAAALHEGQHYAVPWVSVVSGFFYNRSLMEQAGLDPNNPPRNIGELDQALDQARENLPDDVILIQLDTTNRTVGLFHQWPIMLTFNKGVPPVIGSEVNFNTEGMVAYGEWIRKQMQNNHSLPGKRYGEFRPQAADNRLLFGFDISGLSGIMLALNENLTIEDIYENWGATAFPADMDGNYYNVDTNHCLVIFKDSPKKEAAARLIEFLVNSDYAISNYVAPFGYTPVTYSAADHPEIAENPIVTGFVEDVLPYLQQLPFGPHYKEMSEIIMISVQEIISSDRAVKDILDEGQTRLENLLSQ
jgi:ABC-type glycerol-3-phosphate transport system substrate-binding protein